MRDGAADLESRARTHLANERTFLAWFRTGFTLIAIGLAGGQFLARDVAGAFPVVRTLSTVAILTGLFLVLVGAERYIVGRQRIDASTFHPARLSIVIATGAATAFAVLAILFVWLQPGP